MKIPTEIHAKINERAIALDLERQEWFSHWREVAEYFLPRRYPWLRTQKEQRTSELQNRKLLDSTSTLAIRTLASGMMSGITSPARAWFRLRFSGFTDAELSDAAKIYLGEVERRMATLMAESNIYNSLAVLYLEWCAFGTASMAIYEDYDDVFRCYNFPLGEFYIAMDATQRVDCHARRFSRTIKQAEQQWGSANLSASAQKSFKQGGAALSQQIEIMHLIEKNNPNDGVMPGSNAPFREIYWEVGTTNGEVLSIQPLYEWPCITPRWELIGNNSYGVSPAMDCLADVRSLQQLHLERASGLAKQVRPPMIVDQQLRNRPTALSAGGITYAATTNQNFGARPAYQINLPYGELRLDIDQLRQHIRETCKNDLFNMISQLDSVRSATEIDARREEKLIHLGPVFERFSNEGLDPMLRRIFGIMDRAGLLPEAPPELNGVELNVQYVSIMHDAQRSSGTMAIERYLQAVGQAAGVWPEARAIPNIDELMREYAEGIGIKPKGLNSREEVAAQREAAQAQEQLAQTAQVGNELAAGAKVLSEADVGGGMNALQAIMG
jgi:hypothetical protein